MYESGGDRTKQDGVGVRDVVLALMVANDLNITGIATKVVVEGGKTRGKESLRVPCLVVLGITK